MVRVLRVRKDKERERERERKVIIVVALPAAAAARRRSYGVAGSGCNLKTSTVMAVPTTIHGDIKEEDKAVFGKMRNRRRNSRADHPPKSDHGSTSTTTQGIEKLHKKRKSNKQKEEEGLKFVLQHFEGNVVANAIPQVVPLLSDIYDDDKGEKQKKTMADAIAPTHVQQRVREEEPTENQQPEGHIANAPLADNKPDLGDLFSQFVYKGSNCPIRRQGRGERNNACPYSSGIALEDTSSNVENEKMVYPDMSYKEGCAKGEPTSCLPHIPQRLKTEEVHQFELETENLVSRRRIRKDASRQAKAGAKLRVISPYFMNSVSGQTEISGEKPLKNGKIINPAVSSEESCARKASVAIKELSGLQLTCENLKAEKGHEVEITTEYVSSRMRGKDEKHRKIADPELCVVFPYSVKSADEQIGISEKPLKNGENINRLTTGEKGYVREASLATNEVSYLTHTSDDLKTEKGGEIDITTEKVSFERRRKDEKHRNTACAELCVVSSNFTKSGEEHLDLSEEPLKIGRSINPIISGKEHCPNRASMAITDTSCTPKFSENMTTEKRYESDIDTENASSKRRRKVAKCQKKIDTQFCVVSPYFMKPTREEIDTSKEKVLKNGKSMNAVVNGDKTCSKGAKLVTEEAGWLPHICENLKNEEKQGTEIRAEKIYPKRRRKKEKPEKEPQTKLHVLSPFFMKSEGEYIEIRENPVKSGKSKKPLARKAKHLVGVKPVLTCAQQLDEAYRRRTPDNKWKPPRSFHNLLQEDHAHDPWRVLVICLLLNVTTGLQAGRVISDLFTLCPDAKSATEVETENITEIIRSLGLYNKRAVMIQRLSREYLDESWTHVTQLHGVGKYAADAYAIFCNGKWDRVRPNDHMLDKYWEFLRVNRSMASQIDV